MIASPLITTLGGTCCRPRALRNRLNTTTILVNEVTITATNGASARPTTVTRMTPGLRLPKSISLEREQLHAEYVSHRHQFSVTHACAIGSDYHTHRVQAVGQLEHIPGLQGGQLPERQGQVAQVEVQADRNVVRRAGCIGI